MLWRTKVGAATLYGIEDGASTRDPLQFLIGSSQEALAGYSHYLNPDGSMPNSFSCFLFDTGSSLVMIDTGFGYNVPPGRSGGQMPAALGSLGVVPSDVQHVVFTHLHPDHVLGSLDGAGAPLFANAPHWTLRREVEHWRAGSDERSRSITRVADALDEAGVLHVVAEPGAVVPGVTTVAAFGHSPGHTAVRVHSGDESVLIVGDLTFTPIQIDHPEWSVPFDGDKAQAARMRSEIFDQLTASGETFLAGHYEQPGLGRVVSTPDGRRYEAIHATELLDPPSEDDVP